MSSLALREHLRLFDELRQIVTAMRNLAYAELQRLERALAAQVRAQACVLQALADVGYRPLDTTPCAQIRLIIGSERGFCGGFNEALLDYLRQASPTDDTIWLIAGSRLQSRLGDLAFATVDTSGSSSLEECPAVVDAWLDLLNTRLPQGATLDTLDCRVIHHNAEHLAETRLLPYPSLPLPSPGPRPGQTLPNAQLHPALLADALRIGLLGACYTSLAQENRWRLMQMQRAEDHLDEASTHLRQRYFRARQTDITSELETLMSSLDLAASSPARR